MRADKLTENQDRKFGHFSPGQLLDREDAGTPTPQSFYTGTGLHGNHTYQESGIGRGQSEIHNDVIKQGEETGSFVKQLGTPAARQSSPSNRWRLPKMKNVRQKSAAVAIVVGLLGGGGFLATEWIPAAAPLQLKEVFSSFTNYQQKAVDSRMVSVMRAKFKSSDETCTSAACKEFAGMTEDEAKNLESRNRDIKINLTDVTDGSGKIDSITLAEDGKAAIVADSADKFSTLINDNQSFRSAWSTVYNTNYESVSDPKARETFVKDKATKNMNIDGENDEERQKKLNEIVTSGDDSGAKTLTKVTDKDGNTTYVDETTGEELTQSEYDQLVKDGNNLADIGKAGGLSAVLDGTLPRALTADQAGEAVCTTWNMTQRVSALAKTVKKVKAIRYALALVLTLADKIKAGDATEDEVNFSGSTIMAEQSDKPVVDDSKLASTTNGSVPMVKNPQSGGNGLNAESYNMAAYGDVEPLSSRASKFILTAGSVTVLDTITSAVAKIVNGGNPDPKAISQKCGYLQSNLVRVGALGLGIIAGVATFGTWQIVGTAASAAWSIAQPSIEAAAADILSGDLFTDISGMDSVDATYVGTASLMGDIAQSRGMIPVTNQEGEDYINSNTQSMDAYEQDQRYLARATPFDSSNRYSFLGSLLFAMTPTILESRSNVSIAMMHMASMIPTAFTNFFQTAKADTGMPDAFFHSCPDQTNKAKGIEAGPYCEMLYMMPKNSLDLGSVETFNWMVGSGNIDKDTKEVKDNGQAWNYAKYLQECPNRTMPWGSNEEENEGDGTDCYSQANEPLNKYFRAYTIDQSVDTGIKDTSRGTNV